MGRFRGALGCFERFWDVMERFGTFWYVLVRTFWYVLVFFGGVLCVFWDFCGTFWNILNVLEHFWEKFVDQN